MFLEGYLALSFILLSHKIMLSTAHKIIRDDFDDLFITHWMARKLNFDNFWGSKAKFSNGAYDWINLPCSINRNSDYFLGSNFLCICFHFNPYMYSLLERRKKSQEGEICKILLVSGPTQLVGGSARLARMLVVGTDHSFKKYSISMPVLIFKERLT